MLGECSSKIQHIVGTPLTPGLAAHLNTIYVSKGVHGTAAIEGNTLTEGEVERRLQGELDLPPSQEYLGREIDNLLRAYNLIAVGIPDASRQRLTEADIKEFNRLVLDNLPLEEDVVPGEYAQRQHGVARYRAPSPTDIRRLMPALVEWLADDAWEVEIGSPFAIPILRAMIAHLYLAWIHPFGDGNGRTARLVEADLLARCGVPAISYHILSSHFNKTRAEYYRVLARTSATSQGDPGVFIDYALQGLLDGLRQQVHEVKEQHRAVVWRDFVHDRVRGDSPRLSRIRRVALDLASQSNPVPRAKLWLFSERVAALYQGRTSKTLTRDINELLRMKLVRREKGGFVANLELIESFVPVSRARRERQSREAKRPLQP
jgi:Fic family protein